MAHEINGFLGLTGSGKSLTQTELKVLAYILEGREVWCSYWLNISSPKLHYFNSFEQIRDLRNCVVVFDEVTDFFDPREWEKEGSEVRRWFRLHRHHHIDIIFNTQDISLVAKTIGTLCHNWYYCEKVEDSFLVDWFFKKILRIERIGVEITQMTYQELKKIANGWELGEQIKAEGRSEVKYYRVKKLLHHELDDQKIELVHRYCPLCETRQGEQILKADTLKICEYVREGKNYRWRLKEPEMCPNHDQTPLEIRETGVYDTDYEPEVPEVKGRWVLKVPSPAGYSEIEYKGAMGTKNIEEKRRLEARTKYVRKTE